MMRDTGNSTKKFFILSFFLSELLIGAGYGIIGKWIVNIFLLLHVIIIYLSIKFKWKWSFNLLLICNSILATIGILVGAPSILMMAGVATTLTCWELSTTKNLFVEIDKHDQFVMHEKNRLRLLLISIGSGLTVAGIALYLQYKLPFIVIFLLVIIILFCFFQLSRLIDPTS